MCARPAGRVLTYQGFARSCRDGAEFEHVSAGKPRGQPLNEVGHRCRLVGMGSDAAARSVKPSDFGAVQVDAGHPPVVRAPRRPTFDQRRVAAQTSGERSTESGIGEMAVC